MKYKYTYSNDIYDSISAYTSIYYYDIISLLTKLHDYIILSSNYLYFFSKFSLLTWRDKICILEFTVELKGLSFQTNAYKFYIITLPQWSNYKFIILLDILF